METDYRKKGSFLVILALLAFLPLFGCSTKQGSRVFKMYEGPQKPHDQVAMLYVDKPLTPVSVNGKALPYQQVIETRFYNVLILKPGYNRINFQWVRDIGTVIYASPQFKSFLNAKPGYIYKVKGQYNHEYKNTGTHKWVSPDGKKTTILNVNEKNELEFIVSKEGKQRKYRMEKGKFFSIPHVQDKRKTRVAFYSEKDEVLVIDGEEILKGKLFATYESRHTFDKKPVTRKRYPSVKLSTESDLYGYSLPDEQANLQPFVFNKKDGTPDDATQVFFISTNNGEKLVYHSKSNGNVFLHCNGNRWGPYISIGEVLSQNGKDYFYYAKHTDKNYYVFKNGEKVSPASKKYISMIGLTQDGILYAIEPSKKHHDLYLNGDKLNGQYNVHFPYYMNTRRTGMFRSPDGKHVYFGAIKGNSFSFMMDDEEIFKTSKKSFHDMVYNVIFSPDGRRYAVNFRHEFKSANFVDHLFVDGKKIGRMAYIKKILFTPDSKHFVFIGGRRTNEESIFYDGNKVYTGLGLDYVDPESLRISEDGKWVSFIALDQTSKGTKDGTRWSQSRLREIKINLATKKYESKSVQ